MNLFHLIDQTYRILGEKGKDERDGLFFVGSEEVHKVGFAVDPSLTAISKSVDVGVHLLITHHWILPSKQISQIGVLLSKKLRLLAKHDISLASFHLILDFAELGNFDSMMKNVLELKIEERLFSYKDVGKVLPACVLSEPVSLGEIVGKLESKGYRPRAHTFGPSPKIQRIVVDTGGGGFLELLEAIYPWQPDLYITGESKHESFRDARDLGINIIYLGHYESERGGLFNLMNVLRLQLPEIEFVFIEDDNPY